MSRPFLLLLLCSCSLAHARPSDAHSHYSWLSSFWKRASRNVPEEGYYDPSKTGGGMLTQIPVTYPMGLGEPLNVIISGHSDESVLVNQETKGGLLNYFVSIGFSGECLGQTSGSRQAADLGDGNGTKNQTSLMRWNYGDPELGSCKESIQGGNHFRYWIQDGPNGNSGAIFLAVSVELPIAQGHDIVMNGYNLGRDELVGNITKTAVPTLSLNANDTYEATGQTSYAGYTYDTHIQYVSGLLGNTSDGVNHQYTVQGPGFFAMDGLVAVLTVSVSGKPSEAGNGDAALRVVPWTCALALVSVWISFVL